MKIPKGILQIADCAATDNTRYVFNGVLVRREDDGKCVAASTDGRRLIVAKWDDTEIETPPLTAAINAPCTSFQRVIPARVCKQAHRAAAAIKGKKKRIEKRGIVCLDEHSHDGEVRLETLTADGHVSFHAAPIDGKFPPFDDVTPKHDVIAIDGSHGYRRLPAARVCVNAEYLLGILEAMLKAAPAGGVLREVTIEVPLDPKRPVKIVRGKAEGGGDVEVVGVLMPVNVAWKKSARIVDVSEKSSDCGTESANKSEALTTV